MLSFSFLLVTKLHVLTAERTKAKIQTNAHDDSDWKIRCQRSKI